MVVELTGTVNVVSAIRELRQTYPTAVDIERYRLSDFQELYTHYSYSV